MTDLQAMSPLGADAPWRETVGSLTLSERDDLGLVSLAQRSGAPRPAPFGLALGGPGEHVANEAASAFWTGPGQWMLVIAGAAGEYAVAQVAAAAPGASLSEQTDGWVVFEIATNDAGEGLDRLLEKLVNLPPDAVVPGRAMRTLLHHMSVFIVRPRAECLWVFGARSFARSLRHALSTVAARMEHSA